ncbi:MAG: hypothetical protein AB1458_13560 [Bacteroidota bacterium]
MENAPRGRQPYIMMLRVFLCLVFPVMLCAQDGTVRQLQVIVTDEDTGEPLPFACVSVTVNGQLQAGAVSDLNGMALIRINDTTADLLLELKIMYIGYETSRMTITRDSAGKFTVARRKTHTHAIDDDFGTGAYPPPDMLTGTGKTFTREEYWRMPR